MKKIEVYDDNAEAIEKKAEELDVSVAYIIDALIDYLGEVE